MIHLALALVLPAAAGLQSAPGQTAAPSGAAPGPAPAQAGNPLVSLAMPLLLCAVVFYLLVLGPERKQRKKREEMLKNLTKGDKVMTTGGMHATVAQVQDDVVTLQIADGVRARFSRSAVQTILTEEGEATEKAGERTGERAIAKR
jgi:preprotein translocase subunit YajC